MHWQFNTIKFYNNLYVSIGYVIEQPRKTRSWMQYTSVRLFDLFIWLLYLPFKFRFSFMQCIYNSILTWWWPLSKVETIVVSSLELSISKTPTPCLRIKIRIYLFVLFSGKISRSQLSSIKIDCWKARLGIRKLICTFKIYRTVCFPLIYT